MDVEAVKVLLRTADALGLKCELVELEDNEMMIFTGLTVSPTVASGDSFTIDQLVPLDEGATP